MSSLSGAVTTAETARDWKFPCMSSTVHSGGSVSGAPVSRHSLWWIRVSHSMTLVHAAVSIFCKEAAHGLQWDIRECVH